MFVIRKEELTISSLRAGSLHLFMSFSLPLLSHVSLQTVKPSLFPFSAAGFDENDSVGGKSRSATKDENLTDGEDSEEGRQSSSLGWADCQPWWEESSLLETGLGPLSRRLG